MKKILLMLVSAVMALTTRAMITETPEGIAKDYKLSAYYPMSGAGYFQDIAIQLIFSEDGKYVYFKNLFPDAELADEWHTGVIEGDKVTISKDEVCAQFIWGDWTINYNIGECENEDGLFVNPKDIVLVKDGNHIYLDDDVQSPTRYIAFYQLDGTGYVGHVDYLLALDLQPADEELQPVVIPESAAKSDYIFYTEDIDNVLSANKGIVAVDGNDYYFDHLLNVPGVVKGTREGNKITIKDGQYLGNESGFYLFAGGIYMDGGYDLDTDAPTGTPCDVVFKVGEDGTLTLDDDDNVMVRAYKTDGNTYMYSINEVIEPYAGDAPTTPSDPWFVSIDDEDYEAYGQYYFLFSIDNLDVKGKYMNPEKMGYYIYVDNEVYELTTDVFPTIEENMTLVPYGYSDQGDAYGNHDILWLGDCTRFWFGDDMFVTLGVQSVYTVDGVVGKSNVVSVDLEGNTYINGVPTGVDQLNVQQPVTNPSWYDLNGRRVNGKAQHGLYIVDGKVVLK